MNVKKYDCNFCSFAIILMRLLLYTTGLLRCCLYCDRNIKMLKSVGDIIVQKGIHGNMS